MTEFPSGRDRKSARHTEEFESKAWCFSHGHFDIGSQRQAGVGTEGLDDDVSQTTVSVVGRLVRLLAGLWEVGTAEVQVNLLCKFATRKRFQACNAIPAINR